MLYEHRKHDGSLPIVGVNTFLAPRRRRRHRRPRWSSPAPPRRRSSRSSTGSPTSTRATPTDAPAALARLQQAAMERRQRLRRADGRRPVLLARADHRGVLRGRRPVPPQRLKGPPPSRPSQARGGALEGADSLPRTSGRHRDHPATAVRPGRGGRPALARARLGGRRRRDGGGHLADARAGDRAGPGGRRPAPDAAELRPLRAAHAAVLHPAGLPAHGEGRRAAAGAPGERDQRGHPAGGGRARGPPSAPGRTAAPCSSRSPTPAAPWPPTPPSG